MRCLSFLFDGTFLPQCRQTRVRIDVLYYVYVFPLDLVASFYLMKWYRFGSGRKCFTKSVLYTDKSVHLPSEAILITTYAVDTKSLQTRFSLHPNLKDQRIKIIDGLKLVTLLMKHKPDIVKELMGINVEITSKLRPALNNRTLLAALGARREKDIKTIYSDIDFSLGKISTNLFFNYTFKPIKQHTIEISKNDWELFKKVFNVITKEFSSNFLGYSIEEIEETNKQTTNNYKKWKEKFDFYNLQLENDKLTLDNFQKERNDQIKKVEEINKKQKLLGISSYSELKTREEKVLSEIMDKISKLEKSIYEKTNKIRVLKLNESKILYNFTINGLLLANEVRNKRQWIEDKVKEYNARKPSSLELKAFFEKCTSIIDIASIIFNEQYFSFFGCLGYEVNTVIRADFESTRFKLSLDQVFDTGLNIALLGEAGAGKTTSVEMYAYNREDAKKIVILAPLGYVIQSGFKKKSKLSDAKEKYCLDEWIASYLVYMGIQISFPEFRFILENEKVVLLLDGLDEAIKLCPWLPEGINMLAEKYKNNVQIIVTSRMYGDYVDKIPFFAVTLLPFTIEQRDNFIKKWFEVEDSSSIKIQCRLVKL